MNLHTLLIALQYIKWKRVIFSVILTFFLLACETEDPSPSDRQDLPEKPEINILSVSPESQILEICGEDDPNGIALFSTDTLSLTFTMKAFHGLSQYKIDIHSNFDCHTHGTRARTQGIPWQVLEIKDVEGQDITVTQKLPVPTDVQAGDYHFMLQALDLKGNEADWVLYSLQIQNINDTQSPEIEFINPSNDSISISNTENVQIEMDISDNQDLFGGRVDITYLNPSGTEFTAEQYFFPEGTSPQTTYNFSFAFSTTPASGKYIFIIKAFDAVGNEVEKRLTVFIEG